MKRTATALIALLLLLGSAPARAFVPQTITVDGVNDFDPSNLLKDDRNDTQKFFCTPDSVRTLDLGRVYVTNDANYLYIGIEFPQSCFCNMNLGMAFDVGSTAAGGTTDPFGRKIGWTSATFKPDFAIYDVTPTSCNTFNYEVLYKDTLATWSNISARVNPAWGSGANGLGIIDSVYFKEMKLPLSVLGATFGTPMHLEFWVTQEGTTKGPLDALASDDVQMSHPSTTTFDTAAVVQMTQMLPYTVQTAVDIVPPTVVDAKAVGFAVLANKQFGLTTNKIDVTFSEPVDLVSAQTTSHYAYSGPLTRSIISAVRDGATPNVVHLTLSTGISANAAAYSITVTGVNDLVANTIVASGTTNVGAFFLQNVVFNGDFRLGLCNGTFTAADTFSVEGSLPPLTFSLCDNAVMTDTNADSIYTVTVPFCLVRDRATLKGTGHLEWKFVDKCNTFEPLANNRTYDLSSDNGATVAVNAAWNNDDPANFLAHAVDVIFMVDATRFNPGPTDIITLMGNAAPLAFTQPGVLMKDDGVAPDAAAGDKIYTARVTFPSCAPKNVDWKVDFNGTFECLGQGNRNVYLNDALFSSATPIVLPARGIDRCTVTDKPVAVVFKLDVRATSPLPPAGDTLAVMGNAAPLVWVAPPAAEAVVKDDGATYDTRAGDGIYTRTIVFPDSTNFPVEYKFWHNGVLECFSVANRGFTLDDVNYSAVTPMIRHLEKWDYCTDYTAVQPTTPPSHTGNAFASLRPVMPNPVAKRAAFSFDLYRSGRVTLNVYDVTGRRVARLLDATMQPGVHNVTWEGMSDSGLHLANGVYLYELAMEGNRLSRRMILVR
jgi:hypothetical protein